VYRACISRYKGNDGSINFNQRFRPMKSLSCPGCNECDWLITDLEESDFNIINDGFENGDLVTIIVTDISTDWESGYIDDYKLKFIKFNEPQ
jgi:hypothetical protein